MSILAGDSVKRPFMLQQWKMRRQRACQLPIDAVLLATGTSHGNMLAQQTTVDILSHFFTVRYAVVDGAAWTGVAPG